MNDINQVKSKAYVYCLSINCVFGSFLFGYEMMSMGSLQPLIVQYNHLKPDMVGLWIGIVTASLPLGALLGCLMVNRFTDIMGPRRLLILLDVGSLIFISLQMLDLSIFILVFSRLFIGAIIGMNSSVIPAYLVSLSPPSMAGITGSLNQLFITIGIAVAYTMGFTIGGKGYDGEQWRWVLFLPAFACILRAANLIFYVPFDSLDRHYQLNEQHYIQKYCEIVYKNIDAKTLVRTLFQKKAMRSGNRTSGYYRRFKLALIVGIAGQFSGINAILFYAKQIFLHITGNDQSRANYYCLGLGLAQTATTLISGLFLDRCGKRTFMLSGQLIILCTLLTMALAPTDLEPLFIVMIFIHIVGFSLSLGPIIWMYISEILKEQNLIIAAIWVLTIFAAISTEMLITSIGFGWMCMIYFGLEFLVFAYIWRYMKETTGKSPKEIEQMFEVGMGREEDEGEALRL